MKKKDIQKLHQSSIKELREKLAQVQKELIDLRMSAGKEKTKDVKAIKKKRGDLARVLTILKEKEFLEEVEEGKKKKDEKI